MEKCAEEDLKKYLEVSAKLLFLQHAPLCTGLYPLEHRRTS